MKTEALCLTCGDVMTTDGSPSAGAVIYRCVVCGTVVDWEIADDGMADELRREKRQAEP
jgi:DNA-directed RNA polymerase subunit RPC12/RpoP